MSIVRIRKKDSIDTALKRFKKSCKKDGIIKKNSVNKTDSNHSISPQFSEIDKIVLLNGKKHKLSDIEDSNLINLSDKKWIENTEYISHPLKENCYIEKTLFKNYILREILNDIVNYILDHFGLTEFTVGIVSDQDANNDLGFSIPIKDINANAKINTSLSQEYTVKGSGYEKSSSLHESIWIEKFPEIITAVEHNAKSFERIEKLERSLSSVIEANIFKVSPNSNLKNDNRLSIYISFTQ